MKPIVNRLAWRIGGAQGSGVDTAANLFARALAFGGLHVFGKREYYSNIMGEHSYFELRVAGYPVLCHTTRLNVLATFDAETIVRHSTQIAERGALIYDPKLEHTPLDKLPTLEARVRDDLNALLDGHGLSQSVDALLQLAQERGVVRYPVPYEELLRGDEVLGKLPYASLKRMVNTMSVAATCALLGYPLNYVNRALNAVFAGKQKVYELNEKAGKLAFDYVENTFSEAFERRIEPLSSDEKRVYLTGNQAVALGKLAAGCSVQTYYPISPATDESSFLEAHEVFGLNAGKGEGSIVVLQTGDEIDAICSAIGASLSGARAATSTSGPGFCLMVEALGWAGINETPVVVTLYQRGGPSTGLPTRTEQGDLGFVVNAGHGEFPCLVLASGDLEEAFYDTLRTFNYAERYQTPVIHLLDKGLASYSQTYPYFDLSNVRIERGALLRDDEASALEDYRRFAPSPTGISPRSVLGQRGGISWHTGDESDERGHITEDPVIRDQMMEKRAQKMVTALEQIPKEEQYVLHGDPEAPITLVGWGSTKGAILEACERLNAAGHNVNFLQGRLMSPFPAEGVAQALAKSTLRVGIEENFSGQFAGLVRQHTGLGMDHLVLKYNGRPITVDEVETATLDILAGKVAKRVVLRHGV